MTGIRVAVRSFDRLYREALATLLAGQEDLVVIGATGDLAEFSRLCRLCPPDVALIDLSCASSGSAELTEVLLLEGVGIVLTYERLSEEAVATITRAGLTRLVPHSRGLAAVIVAVREGRGEPGPRRPRPPGLTERDLEVVALMSAGYCVTEMASALGISPATVQNHKRRIFTKMSVGSQAHAVALAARCGLLWSQRRTVADRSGLTPREIDILRSIARGHSVRQTAAALGIKSKTVEATQRPLFRKLSVHNRAEALAVAYDLGLVHDS
ncbi:LuxR family transcriptional regulator [Nonomuraea sp. NPDC050536]|uniref:LuxR family transcriptional regulator n=1 Tax=Nonomuraea sp. NPDC050536 TaxID=3364366 RepID=UPI0037CC1F41